MKPAATALFLTLISLSPSSCAYGTYEQRLDLQGKLEFASKQLDSMKVKSVEILFIPSDVLFGVAVTPDRLHEIYSYKIVISRFGASRQAPMLAAALKKTKVSSSAQTGDIRWGVSIEFTEGPRLNLYLDGFGKFGEIDGHAAKFDGALYSWLQTFAACVR